MSAKAGFAGALRSELTKVRSVRCAYDGTSRIGKRVPAPRLSLTLRDHL